MAGLAFTALTILCTLLVAGTPVSEAGTRAYVNRTVAVSDAVNRSCAQPRRGAGVQRLRVATPALGNASFTEIGARLRGSRRSDWDLAILEAGSGRVIAASTFRGSREVATGYLRSDSDLIVQACRLRGSSERARVSVAMRNVTVNEHQRSSLVFVDTPTRRDKQTLSGLGLDMTEHGGEDFVAVIVHSAADRAALDRVGLTYDVEVADLGAENARARAADRRYARAARRSALPSGRDTYRRLFHYTAEMKALAQENPNLVRPITLPEQTYEGRPVEGIEITTDADNIRDGKPVFLQMGVHHAREWPSGEHAMEWAHELIKGYRNGNERVRNLVQRVRTIVIPIVNPDGFNASREAGEAQGSGNGEDGSFISTFPTSPQEYRRKNCRLPDDSPQGNCAAQPGFGIYSTGVDPNRNYGGFWGGETGSSTNPADEDYRGPGPFSEPETRNIRSLVSHRQVTVLITNHTFSNLVLRPPGIASQPEPIDEPIYKALADAMAGENGYLSQRGYELYDTSGTTEDWSYNATGGFGFTFEIYCDHIPDGVFPDRCGGNFHPTFPNVVDEYIGGPGSDAPSGGGGNREAYFLAMETAANTERHSLLRGEAPAGAVITLEKTFQTPTLEADPASVTDHLETRMEVPASGRFRYHVNPSTRPLVALSTGRVAHGSPSPPITFSKPAGDGNSPSGSAGSTDEASIVDHPFVIPGGAGVDNDSVSVRIEWATPASDWDMQVFQDTNGDGKSYVPDGPDEGTAPDDEPLVAKSQQGPSDFEATTFVRPEGSDGSIVPGNYVVRVTNFAAVEPYSGEITFAGPEPFVPGRKESWKLTCSFGGENRVTRQVEIDRGEQSELDLSACATRPNPQTGKRYRCQGKVATLVGTRRANRIIGTPRRDVIIGLGGADRISGRGGNDVICATGGNDRVTGGKGRDAIQGGKRRDRVHGGPGRDLVKGGDGRDGVFGEAGPDRLRGGRGNDRLRGGKGRDHCVSNGGRDRYRSCELPLRRRGGS